MRGGKEGGRGGGYTPSPYPPPFLIPLSNAVCASSSTDGRGMEGGNQYGRRKRREEERDGMK